MEVYILNQNFEKIGVIDDFESLIWTSRYYDCGDFEIEMPAASANIALLQKDNYVKRFDDNNVMIIERLEIKTDVENGNYILASGRCLKSLLDRRIIWGQQYYTGTPENVIRSILTRNIISPAEAARTINNFTLASANDWPGSIDTQYTGDSILEIITDICRLNGYGFEVTLNSSNQFVFSLYTGTDRSYNQDENLEVIFSPDYDNIISTDYIEDKTYYKNVALIAGEGEGAERKYKTRGTETGMLRRELFVDAKDINSTYNDENEVEQTLTPAEYDAALEQRGGEHLAEVALTTEFSGNVDTDILYKYKEDFFIGDIVTAYNEYGVKAAPRITEIIETENEEGYSVLPTFEGWS